MSSERHHAEWLSLTEVSGPFLSVPILTEVFPQNLEPVDSDLKRRLRAAHDWYSERTTDASLQQAWCEFILKEALGYPSEVIREGQAIPPGISHDLPQYSETLQPDAVIVNPKQPNPDQTNPNKPNPDQPNPDQPNHARLLFKRYPANQNLDAPLKGSPYKASPATRMTDLLQATGVSLGLITNGEHWQLIRVAPTANSSYANFYVSLWREEPLTLRAFVSLLSAKRFFGVDANDTLEALYVRSSQNQQDVTVKLGEQVRQAVAVLVRAFDQHDRDNDRDSDRDSDGALLAGVSDVELYNACLTFMMRLVFLMAAEERDLLLLGEAIYDENYAVSNLCASLRDTADQHGEELLERRFDAYARLIATFRTVYAGAEHSDMRLPAYGGTLFDPDTYPLLEGRAKGSSWQNTHAALPRLNNRFVLHVLESIQYLRENYVGTLEMRRLSFRALSIEQIGHIYEGLLDHTAKRADEVLLALQGSNNKEPEVALNDLEALISELSEPDNDALANHQPLIDTLKERTGRTVSALKNTLKKPLDADNHRRLQRACSGDPVLLARVHPFANLLRHDSFDMPMVILPGSIYTTTGTDRRATGAHYTPRALTEPIIVHTLEPLVYEGVAAGNPRSDWRLKSPAELLALNVCDPAMGSGAFLVQACRYLAERLVEAWAAVEQRQQGAIIVTPEGEVSQGDVSEALLPEDDNERLLLAMRYVADRCLYGVDKNPMAVEMAKLSLWLTTLQKGKPFSFLDHALKCGDSLVGVTLDQLKTFTLDVDRERGLGYWTKDIQALLEEVREEREALEATPVLTAQDYASKDAQNHLLQDKLALLRGVGDLLIGCFFDGHSSKERDYKYNQNAWGSLVAAAAQNPAEQSRLQEQAAAMLQGQVPFHWALEFPEVFLRDNAGFDAFVGNPPFLGGSRISMEQGSIYVLLLKKLNPFAGKASDLSSYFFKFNFERLREGGAFGFVATNTIAQSDTRAAALNPITEQNGNIYRAIQSMPWPGSAAVKVAVVHVFKGKYQGEYELDGETVETITPFLDDGTGAVGEAERLLSSSDFSFEGVKPRGMGFILESDETQALIAKNPYNSEVIFPYLNGQDLNQRPDQSPSRWVINFVDYPLERVDADVWDTATADERQAMKKRGLAEPSYEGRVAADYPNCLAILREKVKPEREKVKQDQHKIFWWIHANNCPGLREATRGMTRVFATSRVTKYLSFASITTDILPSEATVVIASDQWSHFTVLSSQFHISWTLTNSSTMKSDIRYTPTDCLETFPFPLEPALAPLEAIGEQYYQHRQSICQSRELGLTSVYNLFHDPESDDDDIRTLRALHTDIDNAVRNAYSWQDIDLAHGFYLDDTPFDESQLVGLEGRDRKKKLNEVRFTINPTARNTVLKRLLALNHARHAQEVKQGFWEKANTGKWKASKTGKAWLKKTRNKHSPKKQRSDQTPLIKNTTPLFPNAEETP